MDEIIKDPFDEMLETERLDLSEEMRKKAREKITYDGMYYSFTVPSYMLFDDQAAAKRKLREAYTQNEFLLIYGYSGCGKSTILSQFASRYPEVVFYIEDFESLSETGLIVKMGECVNLPLKMRKTEIESLKKHLSSHNKVMFLFDEVTATTEKAYNKLEMLRRIHDSTGVPIAISGVTYLYDTIHAPLLYNKFCSLITRLDERKMEGMKSDDASAFIKKISKEENVWFSHLAQQALIRTALNTNIGGINAFTTVIGRCITLARACYYNSDGHTLPDKEKGLKVVDDNGITVLTLPPTPETVDISQQMVFEMQAEYKSSFQKQQK